MEHPNQIPVVNIYGPGSQPEPDTEGGRLDYMTMPTSMSTFQPPLLPEPDEVGDISAALAFLDKGCAALEQVSRQGGERLIPLQGLNDNALGLINQILGVGEVSATIAGDTPVDIQESVMAGLWRVHHLDKEGRVAGDFLEVAAIPAAVRQLAFQSARAGVDTNTEGLPAGVINSPALLVELDEKARHYRAGVSPHVINLSLLPLSPEDLLLLGERLGVGPVTILSRGYGNCRIGSTACRSVWWIKYYNSEDALILNTIEVTAIPDVAVAAPEDIADSAERLREIVEIYR
ncbi:hydrogenase expression/formation protein [Exilibacterium tricleocarpae]|uniref:Hydrogenase expression/formation protein n=1 Tax=Exilibacterium tricleocarpae TaxID=2591008 RepID=A0A545TFG2_9GAMM|nr:hydrogenase expression/formation protein [Exilibacterium tricleocarpae]TQV75969.1 hydrogenase expression/formation protein [Exilibacterium tricleocarpae]